MTPDGPVPDFITSDTHLGHANILDYCPGRRHWDGLEGQGVGGIEGHDAFIVAEWHRVIRPDQIVLHLGDFAFGSAGALREYRFRLPGRLWITPGNHDRTATAMRTAGFELAEYKLRFKHPVLGKVTCRHRPKDFKADDAEWADILLHGHRHGNAAHHDDALAPGVREKLVDAGVDVWGPAPVPLERMLERRP